MNATTAGDQRSPSIASGADGGSVVAWTSVGQDGDQDGIFGRRFDSAGLPLSGDFQVNTATSGDQNEAAIASDDSGNFVVAWTGPDASGGTDVFAQHYDAAGNPLGNEFQVNTYATGYQRSPAIAMNADGFVVVWASSPLAAGTGQDGDQGGIYGQRYSVNGVPWGNEFPVNTYTTGDQRAPRVAIAPYSGQFWVVWESEGQDGDLTGIFGQKFGGSGPPFGGEFQVNSYTTGAQTLPDIAYNGDFVVVWSSEGQDGSGTGIFGHVFSTVWPGTVEFQVNRQTSGAQTRARIAGNDFPYFRRFIVVWASSGQDDPGDPASSGVFAQRFNNSPFPTASFFLVSPPVLGPEYRINTYTTGSQAAPDIALGPDGRFVVAWESADQDGSGEGVFARRFNFPVAAGLGVDTAPSGGPSNVNRVLEAGERVTVAPAWENLAPGSLALFGSAANITGPPGPAYTIEDPNADYGTIAQYGINNCLTATGNCYEVTVSGSRPALHWDATFDETPASFGPLGAAQTLTKTWALHVGGSFPDVPADVFYPFIENVLHNGVTAGGGCGAGLYCGEDGVLRQQMAVFLLKSSLGGFFTPPPATGAVFADVPVSNPFAPWIEDLARRGITAGCTAPPPPELPSYCPTDVVNRQQMAVFLFKTYWGFDASPYCSGVFDDVPCASPFAPYVEFLYYAAIAGGCQASPPLFCPTDPTKRKQMAALLVKTFGLHLYGPD